MLKFQMRNVDKKSTVFQKNKTVITQIDK
ncbi:23S rRNA methyltransferase attenuation leader peptide [Facklamia lactis]